MTQWFTGVRTKEECTARYKALAKSFHPDTPAGSTQLMQQINDQYRAAMQAIERGQTPPPASAPSSPPRPIPRPAPRQNVVIINQVAAGRRLTPEELQTWLQTAEYGFQTLNRILGMFPDDPDQLEG